MFIGSVAAALAIGTRQFGIAIFGGLIVAWALAEIQYRPSFRLLLSGAVVPLIAAAWQLGSGSMTPTITQLVRLYEQSIYLSQSLPALTMEIPWRFSTIMQYAGLCLMSLMPAVIAAGLRPSPGDRGATRSAGPHVLFALCVILILSGLALAPSITVVEEASRPRPRLLPTLPWLLRTLMPDSRVFSLVLTGASIASAVALAWLMLRGLRAAWTWRRLRPEVGLLGATGRSLFALHVLYVQLNDTVRTRLSALRNTPFGARDTPGSASSTSDVADRGTFACNDHCRGARHARTIQQGRGCLEGRRRPPGGRGRRVANCNRSNHPPVVRLSLRVCRLGRHCPPSRRARTRDVGTRDGWNVPPKVPCVVAGASRKRRLLGIAGP